MKRLFVLFISACAIASPKAIAEEPAGIVFREQEGTGLDRILKARRRLLEKRKGAELRGHEWWLWGLSAFDYDQDGDDDLLVCIHGSTNGLIIKNLQKESGKIRFADATEELGVDGIVPSTDDYPLVWDFEGDGDLDIAGLLDDRPTPCLINQDGKRFVEAPFTLHPINHPAGVADLNNDGFPDIFQIRRGKRLERLYDPASKTFQKSESKYEPGFSLPADVKKELAAVKSQKNNRFLKLRYIDDQDLNGDGREDLVISGFGSYAGDRLGWYLLGDEDGGYEDKTAELGLHREGTPFHFQDWDHDGDVDLLIASGERAGLYLNGGKGNFALQEGPLTDFLKRRCPYLHVAMPMDFDNDGDLDLAVSNRRYGQQRVFENKGNGRFEVALASRGWDADPLVLRDLNRDGRMDIIIGGAGEKENIGIFLNQTPSPGNFCKISLRRERPNPFAAGTKVEIFPAGSLERNDVRPLQIESAPPDGSPIHVGLGEREKFDLRVHFPGKPVREISNVQAKPRLEITPQNRP